VPHIRSDLTHDGVRGIAESEIDRIAWSNFREITGPAVRLGDALRRLISAHDAEEVEAAYWQIENHAVVQNDLYPAAEPVASVLVAALADDRPSDVRFAIAGLLIQILSASAVEADGPTDEGNLEARCRARIREGRWLLVREVARGNGAAADVLELIDSPKIG
jgi:hypothetical protein